MFYIKNKNKNYNYILKDLNIIIIFNYYGFNNKIR
jgi:hypothetical protein